jgi:alpha-D-xyloside xylohydrolase
LKAAPVDQPPGLLSDLVDISADFHEYRNTYFLADKLATFDPASGAGVISWARNQLYPRIAFSDMENVLRPFEGVTFPEGEYAVNPTLPFSIQFVSPRTVGIRVRTGPQVKAEEPPRDDSWRMARITGGFRYTSAAGSVTILENPWHIEFRDAQGRLLTRTNHASDNAAQGRLRSVGRSACRKGEIDGAAVFSVREIDEEIE